MTKLTLQYIDSKIKIAEQDLALLVLIREEVLALERAKDQAIKKDKFISIVGQR